MANTTIIGTANSEILLLGKSNDLGEYTVNEFTLTSQVVGSIASVTPTNGRNDAIFISDTPGAYKIEHEWWIEDETIGDVTYGIDIIDISITQAAAIIQDHKIAQYAASNCSQIGISVSTNVEFNIINGVSIPSTTSHILFKDRNADLEITVVATSQINGQSTKTNTTKVPLMHLPTAFVDGLDVVMSQPEGEIVQDIEYDYLNDGNFISSNNYHYTIVGDETIIARDKYGCKKSINISVSDVPPIDLNDYKSELYVSKANPIRFILREAIDLCGNYKNDENTFGCETEFVGTIYGEKQSIRKCWDVRNQFKSSYDTHTAFLYDAETDVIVGNELPVLLIQDNIKYEDSRIYQKIEDNKYSYIYFDEFGTIPTFYERGGILTIGSETQMIIGIVYLFNSDLWAIKTLKFTILDSITAEYTYNKQRHNVYEFDLMSETLPVGEYYIVINGYRTTAFDPNENKTILLKSEVLVIDYEFERGVDIHYYNNTNNDIYWNSGIKGVLTVGLDYRKAINDHELEVVKTDNSSFSRSAFGVEKFEFLFAPMVQEIALKLKYALSQYYVSVNGVTYAFETIEMNSIGDDCNDYVIIATGIKANKNINFISYLESFNWSSSKVKFDSSITFDSTVRNVKN